MSMYVGERTSQLLRAAVPKLFCKAGLEVTDINGFSYAVLTYCKEALS